MTPSLLLALAAAAPVPPADRAAQLEALTSDGTREDWFCTPNASWCLRIDAPEAAAPALRVRDATGTRALPLPALPKDLGFDGTVRSPWPQRIVADAGRTLYFGVITERRTMYSGGGAHDSTLALHRLDADGSARVVLEVPWDGSALIRACFSEEDFEQRAGACHDEYTYTATLAPAAGDTAAAPLLRYEANATDYPQLASRDGDSRAVQPQDRELVHVPDPKCTFSRTFRMDPATGSYVPDQPLPPCGDYTGQ